jgi:hypothetical protein
LKSVNETCYIHFATPRLGGARLASRWAADGGFAEDYPMTIEIFHLTAQIQRWLNAQVARHLAAQAEKFTH